jgi:hypothetical protein
MNNKKKSTSTESLSILAKENILMHSRIYFMDLGKIKIKNKNKNATLETKEKT